MIDVMNRSSGAAGRRLIMATQSDIDLNELCARAMDYLVMVAQGRVKICRDVTAGTGAGLQWEDYDPLNDRAQAEQLAQRFELSAGSNRDIVMAVARMPRRCC